MIMTEQMQQCVGGGVLGFCWGFFPPFSSSGISKCIFSHLRLSHLEEDAVQRDWKTIVVGQMSGFLAQARSQFWNSSMHVLPWTLQSRSSATFHNSNFWLKQQRCQIPTLVFPDLLFYNTLYKRTCWPMPIQSWFVVDLRSYYHCLETAKSKIIIVNWEIIVLIRNKTS